MAEIPLISLCSEILHNILTFLEPRDIRSVCRTCRPLNAFINGDALLFKELYLQRLDDPKRKKGRASKEPAWREELKRLVRFEDIIGAYDRTFKRDNLKFIVDFVEDSLADAAPENSKNLRVLSGIYASPRNEEVFLQQSSIFGILSPSRADNTSEPAPPPPTMFERQMTAKLHCLRGNALQRPCGKRLVHFARANVYDLRSFTPQTLWGPFQDDDGPLKVDWERLEAIMILLTFNLRGFVSVTSYKEEDVWNTPFEGAAPDSFRSNPVRNLIEEPFLPVEAADPYGITGTWKRIVCFLDYTDFYAFNFSSEQVIEGRPREPLVAPEALRIIAMCLRVKSIEAPGPDAHPDYPVVKFTGKARSIHREPHPHGHSTISGTVQVTPEGQVRWSSVSALLGEPRWRSEGVQIGGIRSGRGVYGTWFDIDYDEHGPAATDGILETDSVAKALDDFELEDDDLDGDF